MQMLLGTLDLRADQNNSGISGEIEVLHAVIVAVAPRPLYSRMRVGSVTILRESLNWATSSHYATERCEFRGVGLVGIGFLAPDSIMKMAQRSTLPFASRI
jgi:hypothetical protein